MRADRLYQQYQQVITPQQREIPRMGGGHQQYYSRDSAISGVGGGMPPMMPRTKSSKDQIVI